MKKIVSNLPLMLNSLLVVKDDEEIKISPVKPGSSKRIKQAFHSHICGHEREL